MGGASRGPTSSDGGLLLDDDVQIGPQEDLQRRTGGLKQS